MKGGMNRSMAAALRTRRDTGRVHVYGLRSTRPMAPEASQSLFADITAHPGVLKVRLIGPTIGAREVPIITDLVVAAIQKQSSAGSPGSALKWLVLDMSSVTFINSMGLGMCIDFRNRTSKAGGKAILFGMNPQLTDLFKMVKVDRLFQIVGDTGGLGRLLAG